MPHLSPMNWLMALLSFWLIIMLLSTLQWWNQSSYFPNKSMKSLTKSNTWKWQL